MSKLEHVIKIKINDEQLQKITELSEATGLSKQDVMRYNNFGPHAILKKPNIKLLAKMLRQLAGVSSNLNQSMKTLNEMQKSEQISAEHFAHHAAHISKVDDALHYIKRHLTKI